MNIALIFAGGRGTRMGAEIPKQFLKINEKPILVHTVELFQYHEEIDEIYITTLREYIPYVAELANEYKLTKIVSIIEGGETAQESIYNGLKKIKIDNDNDNPIVLIHDGVRPFVPTEVISTNIECTKKNGNAITSIPAYETVIVSPDKNRVSKTTTRSETFIGQAPQSFYLNDILSAHDEIRKRPEKYENMVDSCTIIRTLGKEAYMVPGNRGNIKITTPEDVYTFKAYLKYKEDMQNIAGGHIEQALNGDDIK